MKIKYMEAVQANKLQHRPMRKHRMAEEGVTVMATVCAVWFQNLV